MSFYTGSKIKLHISIKSTEIHRLSISLYKCSMDIKEPNKYFCRNIIGKLANSMKIDLPWIKI